MPSTIPIPTDRRCTARKADGSPCGVARTANDDRCVFHQPRKPKAHASVTLDALASLDLSAPDGIATARTGVWQHLLAGTLEPHVAKVALDVAETIHRNAGRKRAGDEDVAASLAKRLKRPRASESESDSASDAPGAGGEGEISETGSK